MIGSIIKILVMILVLVVFYYLHKFLRKKIFNYVNQFSNNNCFLTLLNTKFIIELYDDDMYLLSQNFRERCYKNKYKNTKLIKTDDEISIINKDLTLDIELTVYKQQVRKGEIYYKDNNGQDLSIALKDHEEICMIFGKIIKPEINDIKIDEKNHVVKMGIVE